MKVSELRIGNLILFSNRIEKPEIIEITPRFFCSLSAGESYEDQKNNKELNAYWSGIPLTEEWLLRFGFHAIPHFTIGNSKWIDLGRNRRLSVSDVATPNLMVYMQQIDVDGKTINDLICLHNWDYDKHLYVHQLQNLYYALTGKELK